MQERMRIRNCGKRVFSGMGGLGMGIRKIRRLICAEGR
jgi:hypothetical protein